MSGSCHVIYFKGSLTSNSTFSRISLSCSSLMLHLFWSDLRSRLLPNLNMSWTESNGDDNNEIRVQTIKSCNAFQCRDQRRDKQSPGKEGRGEEDRMRTLGKQPEAAKEDVSTGGNLWRKCLDILVTFFSWNRWGTDWSLFWRSEEFFSVSIFHGPDDDDDTSDTFRSRKNIR